MPDPPQLDHLALDRVDQQVRRLVDAPLARVLVFADAADAGIVKQGFGRFQDALGDLTGGFGIVLGDVVVSLLEVGQCQPGPA